MERSEMLEGLQRAVIGGDSAMAEEIAREAVAAGLEPLEAIDKGLTPGMEIIGQMFERAEAYLPELILAARAFNAALKVLEPEILKRGGTLDQAGTIVIGTVKGDIHSIGKDIVANLLKTAGFKVVDLGIDVPPIRFVTEALTNSADIIAASALLTTTMPVQKDIVDILNEKGLRNKVYVMVGGGPVTEEWANRIQADGYGKTAQEAVRVAKAVMAMKKEGRGKHQSSR
ncbi:MAG: corrinoid protein [Bacillota bacterium]